MDNRYAHVSRNTTTFLQDNGYGEEQGLARS